MVRQKNIWLGKAFILGIVLGMILIALVFSLASIYLIRTSNNYQPIQTYPEFQLREIFGNETIDEIIMIIEKVNNSFEYEAGVFDCSQLSQEVVIELRMRGYNATCVTGFYKDDVSALGHTWVELYLDNVTIPIEATEGYIIYWDYNTKYIIQDKGRCV